MIGYFYKEEKDAIEAIGKKSQVGEVWNLYQVNNGFLINKDSRKKEVKLIQGDCLEVLKQLEDNSIDAVVTDPPYELGFMGKGWDKTGIANNVNLWKECLRVLKPGGHLLAFSGTRTYHRMASAIEDAGFEVRDMIEWVYGSGFPKSLNIGKAVDKLRGNEREVVGKKQWTNSTHHFIPGEDHTKRVKLDETKGTSEWEGWGTATKPSHEPIAFCRKPLEKGLTVAENCLKWGTGGINIDECRVVSSGDHKRPFVERKTKDSGEWEIKSGICKPFQPTNAEGRFPANLLHDGSDEVVELFPNTGKSSGGGKASASTNEGRRNLGYGFGKRDDLPDVIGFGDSGSAARFFYCAKASKSERNRGCEGLEEKEGGSLEGGADTRNGKVKTNQPMRKNHHPTVKPIALMEYLIKLVSREGHTILDPFMGSGTTGIACKKLNRHFIGIERDPEYMKIAEARINSLPERLF